MNYKPYRPRGAKGSTRSSNAPKRTSKHGHPTATQQRLQKAAERQQKPADIPVGQSMWDRFVRFFRGDF